jgi:hypothetical protein
VTRAAERALLAALDRERAEEPERLARVLESYREAEAELLAGLERERLEEPERLRAMLAADEEATRRLLAEVLEDEEVERGEVNPDTLGEVTHGTKDDGEG